MEVESPLRLPHRRNRTVSTNERIEHYTQFSGTVSSFCRVKGYGHIRPEQSHGDTDSSDLFVHISDVHDEYVPLPGDKVRYKRCPIPPKLEKFQAVDVHLEDVDINKHTKWSEPFDPRESHLHDSEMTNLID